MSNRARREAHEVALRLTGVQTPPRSVARFDELPGAQVTKVGLPGAPAPRSPARTLQPERAPGLDGDVADAPEPKQACAVVLEQASLIAGSGAVVAADGRLVLESLHDHEHWLREFARPRRIRRPRQIDGVHASLISLWSENYYHWLIDCLPRLATLRAAGLHEAQLIVPDPAQDFQRLSLRALGVDPARTTPYFGEHDHLVVQSLVWASTPAPVNFPTPFVVDWLRRGLRDDTNGDQAAAPPRSPSKRLFVTRAGVRRVTNEDAVMRALEPFGFELVAPDRLSFPDQVAAFAQAEAIVGPHGAGLTNIVFADPAPVLELFPPGRVGWHYYTLARAAGHSYWYLTGGYGKPGADPRYQDFVVDPELLARTVEAMLEAARR